MVRRFARLSIALFSAIIIGASCVLAEVSVRIKASPTSGTMRDTFTLSVILEGSSTAGRPDLASNDDFLVSYIGPQSSVSIINGTVSQKISHLYRLTPKREGELSTPAVSLTIDGEVITRDPVVIKVAKADPQAEAKSNEYWMTQKLEARQFAYVGEQVVNILEIVTRVPLLDPVMGDLTFSDFRNEPLGEQQNERRYVNGRPFTASVIRRALFPIKTGTLLIPARKMQAKVRYRRQGSGNFPFGGFDPFAFDTNVFDDFFGGSGIKDVEMSTEELKLEVKPLPPMPKDLGGLKISSLPVGATSLTLQFDPSEIKFGESKTVIVTIKSEGDLQGIKSLGLDERIAKIYEEAPQTKTEEFNGKLLSTRTISLSVVPLTGGHFELGDLGIRFFDPEKDRYDVARGGKIEFNVIGGPAKVAQSVEPTISTSRAQEPIPSIEGSYREETSLERISRQISLSLALLILAVATLIAVGVLLLFKVLAKLKSRKDFLTGIKKAESLSALDEATRLTLSQKFGLGTTEGLALRAELRKSVTSADELFAIESILDRLEASRFGGQNINLAEEKKEILSILSRTQR